MKFSVLLPTRNRLELLRYAVESVQRQDYGTWEIVISDNASEEAVEPYIHGLADSRIHYHRTRRFVSVTENWNNALVHSTGDYVVMLGDDDALLPGYFSTLAQLVEQHHSPELVYVQAIQYVYPNVVPGRPRAYVQSESCEFMAGRREPFMLAQHQARTAVEQALSLRFTWGLSMQHSLVSRRAIERVASYGPFFQSPYPDFYASNALLLTSRSTLVVPDELLAIGHSPKSFAYYYFNARGDEGHEFLNNLAESSVSEQAGRSLLPGDPLITNTFLAMLSIERNFGAAFGVRANVGRYRETQALYFDRQSKSASAREVWSGLTLRERIRFGPKRLARLAAIRLFPPKSRPRLLEWAATIARGSPRAVSEGREVEAKNILELFDGWQGSSAALASRSLP